MNRIYWSLILQTVIQYCHSKVIYLKCFFYITLRYTLYIIEKLNDLIIDLKMLRAYSIHLVFQNRLQIAINPELELRNGRICIQQ